MGRRLFRAVWLAAALLGTAGGLSGCTVYPAASVGVGYRSPGYYGGPGYYRPYRPYYGGGGGYYGRPYGYGGGYRGYYGRPYW